MDGERSKIRQGEYPQLERALFIWFRTRRAQNMTISGPLLQEKAKMYAAQFGIHGFEASNGWLEGFKSRHDISARKLTGESGSTKAGLFSFPLLREKG
jgi:hypothetical protein